VIGTLLRFGRIPNHRHSHFKFLFREILKMAPIRDALENTLLSKLPAPDFAALNQHLEPITFVPGQKLRCARKSSAHAYYLTQGVAAVRMVTGSNISGEIALLGPEGVVGHDEALGLNDPLVTVEMLSDGQGALINMAILVSAVAESEAVRKSLIEYSASLMRQVAETSLSNAMSNLESRLARRLLMMHDRLRSRILCSTHESLADSLGVRRAGITTALRGFAAAGIVAARRRSIEILDPPRLAELAGGFYA
jgi:CRP-like cAMP-binding protein